MATVDLPRSKNRAVAAPTTQGEKKKKSHVFRYGCILMLALLAAGVWFAPVIIAQTALRQWVLRSALKLDGTVSLGSLSLGWFSRVVAEDLEIRDSAGKPMLQVSSLSTDKPLVGLLLDFADLGQIHVERPIVHVICQEKESNLEQAFASSPNGGTSSARMSGQFEISEGTILIDDVPQGRQFRIENVSLQCTIAETGKAIRMAASGSLPHESQPADFKINLQTEGSITKETPLANGKIEGTANAIPLELLQPLLRRYVDQARLGGRVSTRLGGAWGQMAEEGQASLRGETLATQVTFSSAALGADQIKIERLEIPCHIVENGDCLNIEQLGIQCDLGDIGLSGSVKTADFSAADKLSALVHETYALKGKLDLARLAQLLPETLRIREGAEVTSGDVTFSLSSRQQESGISWTGRIGANHLGARANGRALSWENPLLIEFGAHETERGLIVDQAQCTSNFLQMNAAGSLDDLQATAKFDLARLVSELRQLSDLDHLQLAGNGQAELHWKRVAENQFSAEAQFQARGFQLQTTQGRFWKENLLVAKLDLAGEHTGQTIKRLEHAELSLDAETEHLKAQLQEAVDDPTNAIWPIECSWRGELAHWSERLEACCGIAGWNLQGEGATQAILGCSAKSIEINKIKAELTGFQVLGHDWFISEPAISATAEGHWDLAQSRIDLALVKLVAGHNVARVEHAVLQSTADGWTADGGTAEITAELADLYRWRHNPRSPAAWQVSGRLSSEAQLKYDTSATLGQLSGTIHQLQIVDPSRPATPGKAPAVWQEPQLSFSGQGGYQHRLEQLQLEKIQVNSEALHCDARGMIPLSAEGGNLDLKGTIQYDWEQLAPLWRPYVGQGVQISGRQTRSLAIHGPLTGALGESASWRQVTAEAALGWSGMNIYGLQVSQGDLSATLVDGQLRTQPIDVSVSEGRFTFLPLVRLTPAPRELYLGRGPLLTDIHLNPELCARGLKFIAPILAESTVADGRFSIMMDGGRIPLADPESGDASGHLAIQAQVRPGPLAQEFLILLGELTTILRQGALGKSNSQSGSLLSIDDSEIDFRMVQQRVYHRGLTFMVGGVPITTHGSVGFDESLAIVAEVPIRATFLGRDLSLGTLEGQTLQIPIEGTLGKPKLDRRVLQQLAGSLLQNIARGGLLDEVNKQFERLLPAPAPQP